MATAYPGALDTVGSQLRTDISSSDDLDASGKEHDVMHVNHAGALVALETKLGLTDSNAVDGAILVGSAASTTSWTTSPAISITGTAATATNVTVAANNTADETVYPTFVDGATGAQGIETDTGFTYNPSSGLLTSTTFAGALTGNAATATTAAGLTGGFTEGSLILANQVFS